MKTYTEYRFWSVLHDAWMVRLSRFDERGQEFFSIVPRDGKQPWRERRTEALEAITAAIDMNLAAGEVRMN